MTSDYDRVILNSISTQFKTVKQISDDTSIAPQRIKVRLNSMLKWHEVIAFRSKHSDTGAMAAKYRKMPTIA